LTDGRFLLNKKEIQKDWKLSTANAVLGKPSRTLEGANRVHLHDKKGIVIYEAKKAGKPTGFINELSMYFSVKDSSMVLLPSSIYSGDFEIENMKITKDSKWEDIANGLTNAGYKKKNEYSYSKSGVYVIFRFLDNGLLENISIGKG
jgi:hypothetical protein